MSTTARSRKRRPLTEEEKQQKAQERKEKRGKVAALADAAMSALADSPDAWNSLLWTAAMHPGRPGVVNLALISTQAPGQVTESFHGWRAKGRQVRLGEHGLKIFTAVTRRRDEDDTDDGEPRERLSGFNLGTLFAYNQTDPIPGAKPFEPAPPHPRTADHVLTAALNAISARGFVYEDRPDDALFVLRALGRLRHRIQHNADMGVTHAEGESAAYVAAVMLGLTVPEPAPLPAMALAADDKDPYGDIKATAERVITLGRQLAAMLAR